MGLHREQVHAPALLEGIHVKVLCNSLALSFINCTELLQAFLTLTTVHRDSGSYSSITCPSPEAGLSGWLLSGPKKLLLVSRLSQHCKHL